MCPWRRRRHSPVFGRIVAPGKELLVVDSDAHLLFNEDLDAVLAPVLDRLMRLSSGHLTA